MNPVQPEELSALLDGELDPRGAREVEAQMAAQPELRAQFEALSAADAAWRRAAASAAFAPDVRLPASLDAPVVDTAGLNALGLSIVALIAVRIVLKLIGSEALTLALPALSMALLIGAVVWIAIREEGVVSGNPMAMRGNAT